MEILNNIREVMKNLKRTKHAKIYCPRCASSQIHFSNSFDFWPTPLKYVCENCGYKGPIVMELEKVENGS